MVPDKNKKGIFYIGIDGGGSKCRAVISNAKGELLGTGLGGAANPFYGVEKTLTSIVESAESAIVDTGISSLSISELHAGVGLAGVNLSSLYQQLEEWDHPFAEIKLTTDMDIANIGAHDGQDGAIIIVGTGSSAFVNHSSLKSTLGGYGFPIGDQASGASMGLKAIQHTLLAFDNFVDKGILSQKVAEYYEIASGSELSVKLIGQASKEYAKIASLVFYCADAGDQTAIDIVNQGINYISQLATKINENKPIRLSLIGGLAKYYLPRLSAEVAEKFSPAMNQPEIGALHLAMQNSKLAQVQSA